MQRYFIFHPQRCFGCNGCVAACINANNTGADAAWRGLHKLPPKDGHHQTVYLSVSCNHCENPPCVDACPSNALEKREEDGVVLHHPDKCLGCRYCQMACPYDAIKWEEEEKVVSKCHFCHERLAEGREPACVETCFAGALKMELLDPEDIPSEYETESPGLVRLSEVGPCILFKKEKKDG